MPVDKVALQERMQNIEALEQQGAISPSTAKSLKDEVLSALSKIAKGTLQTLSNPFLAPRGVATSTKGGLELLKTGVEALPSDVVREAADILSPVGVPSGFFSAPKPEGVESYSPVDTSTTASYQEVAPSPAGGAPAPTVSPTRSRFDSILAGQSAAAQRRAEETQKAIKKSTQERIDAELAVSDAEVSRAALESKLLEDTAALQKKAREKFETDQADIRSKQEEMERLITDDINEIASMKITDRRSLGSKIGGAIGIALGAYASTTSGAPNYALQIINKQIDDDIASQRSEIEAKKAKLTGKQNAYQRLREKLGDNNAAYNATRAGYLDQIQNQLAVIAAKHKGTAVEARAKALVAEIRQQSAEAKQKAFDTAADQVRANTQLRMRAQEQADANALAYVKALGADGGKQLPAARAEKIGEFDSSIATLEDLLGRIDTQTDMASFLTKHIPGTLSRDFDNRVRVARSAYRRAMTGVAANPYEIEEALKTFPSSETWDSESRQKITALLETIRRQKDSIVKAYGNTGYDVGRLGDTQQKPLGRPYEG
jgi:hypothetical protein